VAYILVYMLIFFFMQKQNTLKKLIDGITPENIHKEVSWGEPRGEEIW